MTGQLLAPSKLSLASSNHMQMPWSKEWKASPPLPEEV